MIELDSLGSRVVVGKGLIGRISDFLPQGRVFLVTDRNVQQAGWLAPVAASLGGRILGESVIEPGEASKSWNALESLTEFMLDAGLTRDDAVVAIGGGVIGDLAGLAAAIVKRGVASVLVPTSLLAQVDSAIGGKTAINSRSGKNLIGAFHAPTLVLVDIATLDTLPEAEIRSGYAETVKYGLIADRDFFAWCETNGAALIEGDRARRLHAVSHCLKAKARIVQVDPRDRTGTRALLNFGHSFGHAIEAESKRRHGEAVAIGMALAFRLSVRMGDCDADEARRAIDHLASVGLPVCLDSEDRDRLVRLMKNDKKSGADGLRLVLTRGIGRAFLANPISPATIRDFLARC